MNDASPGNEGAFYVVAHADDWQLFMQPNIFLDLVDPGKKTIVIITTAGDAGMGEAFWKAREKGSDNSLKYCLSPRMKLHCSEGNKLFNGHIITYSTIENVTTFFMRLPDGNLNGKGFSANHFESLHKLKHGLKTQITTVDKSGTYNSWEDFCATLQEIIVLESSPFHTVSINYLNPDATANPHDHVDHYTTGEAIRALSPDQHWIQKLYVGYSSHSGADKLAEEHLFWKSGMLAAYEKTVYDLTGYSTLQEDMQTYINWCLSSAKFITRYGIEK